MKPTLRPRLAALAIAAACAGTAHAQSSLTIYGIMDAGVMAADTGARTEYELATGNQAGTRLGFRGIEDLGGGLRATFNLEMGIANDTGALLTFGEAAGTVFGRKSVVGLQGGFGELYLGRDYTPAWWTIFRTDRFRFGLPGTTATSSGVIVTRANNGIFYATPAFGGFRGRLAYTFGAEVAQPDEQGRLTAASLEYAAGKLFVAAAVQRRSDLRPGSTTETADMREGGAGLEYDFGSFTLSTGFWQANPVTATAGAVDKSRAFWLGASTKVGVGQVQVQVTRTRQDVVGRPEQGHALTAGIAYVHPLSKRTSLYAGYGTVRNDANARLALNTGTVRVGGTVFDADPRALLVGVRHDF
ncbi:porin [Ramlibacter sp. USB13]|uniref:Porin n=1 Tax=Ramlibacter cellulosilyticus TaxID=2764187 RepID=A0A923MPA4_9BURK|nr:porin [Ramlibacter cellulosilyticus]MBC5781357.1 porin [Ramlibacter cellulosilyticus]